MFCSFPSHCESLCKYVYPAPHVRANWERISLCILEHLLNVNSVIIFTFSCGSDSNRGCVAKLSFSCPLKGHYCLYAKSCFSLTSRQPHLWIHIMLLHLQVQQNIFSCKPQNTVVNSKTQNIKAQIIMILRQE